MTKLEHALATLPTLEREQQDAIADWIIGAALPVIEFDGDEETKIAAGVAAANVGDFASDREVEDVFVRFR